MTRIRHIYGIVSPTEYDWEQQFADIAEDVHKHPRAWIYMDVGKVLGLAIHLQQALALLCKGIDLPRHDAEGVSCPPISAEAIFEDWSKEVKELLSDGTQPEAQPTEDVDTTIHNETPICPLCGMAMVLRHGTYGDFYGCSTFPKCRGTKSTQLVREEFDPDDDPYWDYPD